MDGDGGTYNPFTNTATIDISGNSATTTLASNSSQLNGQTAAYYTNITARLGYTPVNQAGDTISGNLTVNGNFAVNGSVTAFSASNIYITSSNLTVTDNILLMNALSPYQRYAGIQMYDSGSGTLSQFLWDGDGDYFFLTGSSVNGKIITGPDGQTNLSSNYIPKATAGYKLGNSLIYDNGSAIGIGTTAPAQALDVVGNIRCVPASSAWAEGLSFSMPTTSSWGGLRWRRERANADGNHYIGYIGTDTTDDLVFGSNNGGTQIDNNIRITKAGLVGVGTTSPSTKFHVYGNAEVGDSTADTGLIVRHGSGAAQYGRIRFYSTSTNISTIHSFPTAWNSGTFLNASAGAINLQGSNGITFGSWNSVDVAFAQGGNNYFKNSVGIGTTSPTVPLDVSGSYIRSFSIAGNAEPGFVADYPSSNGYGGFFIHVNNTRRWRIGSVGDTNVQPALNFWQEGTGSRMIIGNNGWVGIGTTSPADKLQVGSGHISIDAGYKYYMDANVGAVAIRKAGTSMVFTVGANDRVYIDNTGSVGIGTSSPGALLDLWSSAARIKFRRTSSYDMSFGIHDSATSALSIKNSADASTLFYVQYDGNIGIGTTAFVYPAANRGLLEVYGSSDALIALRNATANFYIQKSGNNFAMVNGGAGYMTFNNNGSDRLFIDSTGNIGIGTTSVSSNLHIYSSTGPELRLSAGSNGTGGFRFIKGDSGESYINNQDSYAMRFQIAGSTRMSILADSSVGIGTTVPAARLQVNSTTAGATLLRTDGTNGTLFSVVDDLSDSLMSVNNSAGLPVLEVFADDRVVMGQYGQNDFVLRNNKVGIGTNNPQFKLDVTGSLGVNASSLDTNWAFVVSDNSSAGSRYSLNKLGSMGFNNADNYAQLQLLGSSGAYVDFTNSVGGDSNARLIYYAGSRLDLTYGFATTITLNSTGVGIGTTLPTTALHVVGVISGSSFSGAGTGLTGTASSLTAGTVTTNANLSGDVTSVGNTTTIASNAVTTTKIADANVTNAKLANNSITIGSTAVSLGSTATTIAGLTSVTSTTFVGALTGTATTASYANALNATNTYTVSQLVTTGKLEAGGNVIAGGQFSGAGTGLTGTASGLSIGGSAATATSVNGTNGQLLTKDVRTIAPNNIANGYFQFGFTSWTNNNNSPYADYLHLRSYTDSSGGNDNLVMFRKDVIGMRIWQQTFGSASAYSTYKDVCWADGTNASGTWAITSSWATNALNVNNATLTVAAGTGISLSATPTFTSNASVDKTITITNGGVTSAVAGTGVSVSGATGAVTFSIGQAVGTGNSPTFAGVTATSFTGSGLILTNTNTADSAPFFTLNGATTTERAIIIQDAGTNKWWFGRDNNGTVQTGIGFYNYGTSNFEFYITDAGTAVFRNTVNASISGNAATVTNGIYTSSIIYIGTTAITMSRSSASQTLTGVSIDGNAATATTATTANALNTSNSYTVTNLIASGYLQSTVGYLRTDDSNGIEVLTTTNSAQSINVKGILIGSSYDTTPPQNEIRTSNNQSLNLNARGTGDITLSTADGERVRLLNGGNVGVGTSNPGRKLDVEGIVRTRGASGTGGFEISAASSGAAKWRIEWDSASDSLDFNWVG
jgi:hypothetical protein